MADFTKEVKLKVLIEAIKRTGKIKDVQRELNAVSSTAQKTGDKTAKAGAAGSKGIRQIGKSAEEAKKQLEAMSKAASTMVSVGMKLVGIGATLAGTAFFPIIAAARFEKSMSEVLAVTTNASVNFKELNAVALEYGRTTKFTATQAAQGMAFLGRAGLTAAEVVSAIGPSLNLAAAGNIDLARSADIASNVLAAMALDVVDLTHVTDILAHTASSANTDINQLAEALKYAAPVAKAAGVSLEETAAIMGVLGDAGIQASMAGTGVRGMLIALSAPTKQAQDALDELGVTVAKTADGSLDMIKTFEALSKAQMNLGQATAIFRRTSASAAITIASNVSKLKMLTAENKVADGAALKLATTMQANLGGAFTRLLSATSGLVNAFGAPLLKPLAELLDLFAKMVSAVAGLATKFPLISGTVTGVIAVLGVFTTTLGAVLLITGLLIKALVSLKKALKSKFILDAVAALHKYSSAQLLATTATGGLTKALRVLGLVIKTHPLLFLAGVVLSAYAAYKALSKGVESRIEEAKKERRETDRLVSSFDDLTDALLKAEEGSEDQKVAALALREELEKIVETNDRLAPAALKAAQSIDEQTGKINDQNEAIRIFTALAFAEKISATTEQMRLLGIAQKEALDPDRLGLAAAGWNQIRKWIGLSYSTTQKYNEEIAAGQARLEALASTTLAGLQELGRVDPSMSMQQFITLMDGMNLATDETRIHFIKAFTDIRKAHLAETDMQIDREKQTSQEILAEVQARVDKQIRTLSQLSKAYDEISKTARLTPKDLEAQQAMIEAGRARTRVVEKLDASLRLLAQEEVAEAKIAKETAMAALETEKARGEIDQKAAKERKLQIEVDYQNELLRIRQQTLAAFKQAGAAETDEAEAHSQNLINITARATKVQTQLENYRAKRAVELRKEQLKQEQALMEARVDLSAQQIDNELAVLERGYDTGLLDLETYLEKRRLLTTQKLDEEIALLKKKLKQATTKEKPVLEIELRIKEAERVGALADLYAEDDEARQAHAEKVAQTEVVLLGLKKDALGQGLEALREQHILEMAEFDLQTERILLALEERGASEDQLLEAKKFREMARMKTVEAQEQASLTARLSLIQQFAGGAKQLFSDLYDLTGRKSKEMFYIAKAAAVAEAIMNTAKAVTSALPNMAMAAIVGAMGAVQVAKIMAQRMASGGPVVGGSGTKDDVHIVGMGGEFMQPKPTVKYYGADIMEGLRQRLIPKEIFRGLQVPQTIHTPASGHFQEGGKVTKGRAAPSMSEGNGGGEITIINVTDTRELDSYLATPRGQDAILNVLSSRQSAVRRIIR